MARFIVADVGNCRIKWGLCDEREVLQSASLPLDDVAEWTKQLDVWSNVKLAPAHMWTLAGVNPAGMGGLTAWLSGRAPESVRIVNNQHLPLDVRVPNPGQVGIDRLLNAVAFQHRRDVGQAGLLVDAGSAVTIDWVDAEGAFRGGAILPGLRLMAQALHAYTAKLPLIPWNAKPAPMPGKSTHAAIACGIHGAVVGGIRLLVEELSKVSEREPERWLTGGDAALLQPALPGSWKAWPHMTLEGLRLTALRLT